MQAAERGQQPENEPDFLSSVIRTTLLLVASDADESAWLQSLRAGADDGSVKQRLPTELRDRIAVAFVRSLAVTLGGKQQRLVRLGQLSVDLDTEAVLLRGRSLELTPHHRKLLLRLARESGSFVPSAELRECAGIQADRENKNLRNQLWRLRKRLAAADCRLECAARHGYRLVSTSPGARTS